MKAIQFIIGWTLFFSPISIMWGDYIERTYHVGVGWGSLIILITCMLQYIGFRLLMDYKLEEKNDI